MRSTSSWLRAAAALAVSAGLLAGAPGRAGAADPSDLAAAVAPPKLEWSDCGGGFQCATATVPRDYRDRRGPMFQLPVIKWPAKDQSRRIGSMSSTPAARAGQGSGSCAGRRPGPWTRSPGSTWSAGIRAGSAAASPPSTAPRPRRTTRPPAPRSGRCSSST